MIINLVVPTHINACVFKLIPAIWWSRVSFLFHEVVICQPPIVSKLFMKFPVAHVLQMKGWSRVGAWTGTACRHIND